MHFASACTTVFYMATRNAIADVASVPCTVGTAVIQAEQSLQYTAADAVDAVDDWRKLVCYGQWQTSDISKGYNVSIFVLVMFFVQVGVHLCVSCQKSRLNSFS